MKIKNLLLTWWVLCIIWFSSAQFIGQGHKECKSKTGQEYLTCRANYNNSNGINLQAACQSNDWKNTSFLRTKLMSWSVPEVNGFYKHNNKIYYYLWTFNWSWCYQNGWYYSYDCNKKKTKTLVSRNQSYYDNKNISCSSPEIQKATKTYLLSRHYWPNKSYMYSLININKKSANPINIKNFSINKSIKNTQFKQQIANGELNIWREQNNTQYLEIEEINDNLIGSILYINFKPCEGIDCLWEETIALKAKINLLKKKIY